MKEKSDVARISVLHSVEIGWNNRNADELIEAIEVSKQFFKTKYPNEKIDFRISLLKTINDKIRFFVIADVEFNKISDYEKFLKKEKELGKCRNCNREIDFDGKEWWHLINYPRMEGKFRRKESIDGCPNPEPKTI